MFINATQSHVFLGWTNPTGDFQFQQVSLFLGGAEHGYKGEYHVLTLARIDMEVGIPFLKAAPRQFNERDLHSIVEQ